MPVNPFAEHLRYELRRSVFDGLAALSKRKISKEDFCTQFRAFISAVVTNNFAEPKDIKHIRDQLPKKYTFLLPILDEFAGGGSDEQYLKVYLETNIHDEILARKDAIKWAKRSIEDSKRYIADAKARGNQHHISYYQKRMEQSQTLIDAGLSLEYVLRVIKRNVRLLLQVRPATTQEVILNRLAASNHYELSEHEYLQLLTRIQAMRSLPADQVFAETNEKESTDNTAAKTTSESV